MADSFVDECFPLAVVLELRQIGHDLLTAHEAGRAGRGLNDSDVLGFATSQDRAVLTHNRRHFVRLHLQGIAHAGIITCTRDEDSVALALRIHTAVSLMPTLHGQLIRIAK